jgi:endonuclease/exonuclease/phosphatase family metal-dependent hydrolase
VDPALITSRGATVTIASVNLHCGFSGYGRPYDVAAALAGLDADIIAVQEAWWTTEDGAGPGSAGSAAGGNGAAGGSSAAGGNGAADAASATDPVAAAARRMGARLIRTRLASGASLAELSIAPVQERGNWGIAVLSRLPVTDWETLNLGQAPGDLVGRAALICSVAAPGGWRLRLVCTHLSPRLNSPAQLYRLTQHLLRAPGPTVIAGDLNMPRLATWVAGGYAPTVRGRTFPADMPVTQLDHLLVSPGVTCLDAVVLPPVGSDHLPVRGRFSPAVRLARAALIRP